MSCACALGAGQQLAWLRTPKSLLHSGMLRTIFPLNDLGMALTVRLSADQSEHGGHESAGPPSSFSLRIAVSGTVILLQTQGEKRKREDRAGYDETANPEGSPGAR